jgi:hypothetical protein
LLAGAAGGACRAKLDPLLTPPALRAFTTCASTRHDREHLELQALSARRAIAMPAAPLVRATLCDMTT